MNNFLKFFAIITALVMEFSTVAETDLGLAGNISSNVDNTPTSIATVESQLPSLEPHKPVARVFVPAPCKKVSKGEEYEVNLTLDGMPAEFLLTADMIDSPGASVINISGKNGNYVITMRAEEDFEEPIIMEQPLPVVEPHIKWSNQPVIISVPVEEVDNVDNTPTSIATVESQLPSLEPHKPVARVFVPAPCKKVSKGEEYEVNLTLDGMPAEFLLTADMIDSPGASVINISGKNGNYVITMRAEEDFEEPIIMEQPLPVVEPHIKWSNQPVIIPVPVEEVDNVECYEGELN